MQKSESQIRLQTSLKLAQTLSQSIKQMFHNKVQKNKNNLEQKLIFNKKVNITEKEQNSYLNHNEQNNQVELIKITLDKIKRENQELKQQLKCSKQYIQFLQDYNNKLKKQILIWMNQPKDYSYSIRQQKSNQNIEFINKLDSIKKESEFQLLCSNFSVGSQKNYSNKKLNGLNKSYQSTIITNGISNNNKISDSAIYLTQKNENTTADKQTETDLPYEKVQKNSNLKTKNLKKREEEFLKIQKSHKPLLNQCRKLKSNLKKTKEIKKQIQISQFKL